MLQFPRADAWKPLVRRWIGPRPPETPPLIIPLARRSSGSDVKPIVNPPRSIEPLKEPVEEPVELAPSDARQVTDQPSVGDEAIRAALAGIAAELAASELDERKSRWPRFAIGAGALAMICLAAYVVLHGRSDGHDAIPEAVATNPAGGRIGRAEAIKPASPAARSVATNANGALSSDTSSGLEPIVPPVRDATAPPSPPGAAPTAVAKQPARAATANKLLPRTETRRPPISAIVVIPTSVRIGVSRRTTLRATPIDEFGEAIVGPPVSWTSSRRRVATVSSNGVVTGHAPGTAKVTVTIGGKKASVFVTVTVR